MELLRLVDHRGFLAAFGLVSGACFRRYFSYEVKTFRFFIAACTGAYVSGEKCKSLLLQRHPSSEAEPLDKPWLLPFTDLASGEPSLLRLWGSDVWLGD
jgi:hypothetical protein